MKTHLTPEQRTRWLIGDATLEEQEHGRNCPECSASLNRLSGAFGQLRNAVTQWAEERGAGPFPDVSQLAPPPSSTGFPWRWTLVGSTVALAAMFPMVLTLRTTPPPFDPIQDELLLNEVRTHIRRTAPAPMEPLLGQISPDNLNEGELQ